MVRDEVERGRNLPVNMGEGAKNSCDHYRHTDQPLGYSSSYFFYLGAGHVMYGIKKSTAVEFIIIVI